MLEFFSTFLLIIGVVVVLNILERLLDWSGSRTAKGKLSEIEENIAVINERIDEFQKTLKN